MKKIALLMVFCPTIPSSEQTSLYSESSIELSSGLSFITGTLSSQTPNPKPAPQIWYMSAQYNAGSLNEPIVIQTSTPVGYAANWNTMQHNTPKLGFSGELNLHHTWHKDTVATGLYLGIGYNGARNSSTIDDHFQEKSYIHKATISLAPGSETGSIPLDQYTMRTLEEQSGKNGLNIQTDAFLSDSSDHTNCVDCPSAKSIVSFGPCFKAGVRFGPVIGRFFPYILVGWRGAPIKAHLTNQYEPYMRVGDAGTKGGGINNIFMHSIASNGRAQNSINGNRLGTLREQNNHKSHRTNIIQRNTAQINHTVQCPINVTVPQPIPHQTAPRTIPHQTALRTIPHQTAPRIIPHQTAPRTIPDQTAPRTIPHQEPPAPIPPTPNIHPAVIETDGTLRPVHMTEQPKANTIPLRSGYQAPGDDTATFNIESDEQLGRIDAFYNPNNRIKVASNRGWANAMEIGFGMDFAPSQFMSSRWIFGFYYQASIYQKVSFDQWDHDVCAGMTGSVLDLRGQDRIITNSGGSTKDTDRLLTVLYDKVTPKLTIAPIMHTVMFSVKYVIGQKNS